MTVKRRRLIYPPIVASINAAEGHGKTSLLFSAPKPISVFHIDPNTEELYRKLVEAGELSDDDVKLYATSYPSTVFRDQSDVADEAKTAWSEEFLTPLEAALKDDDVRAIGLDTSTEFSELNLMAYCGRTIQIMPEMRTKPNYMFKGLLQALKRSGKHIILLHRTKEHWESTIVQTQKGEEEKRNSVAGMYDREGFNKTGFHVNVEAWLMYEPSRGGSIANQFGMRVSRCLQRPSLVTAQADEKKFWDLEDDAWWWGREKLADGQKVKRASFAYLALQMYPQSSIEDWI